MVKAWVVVKEKAIMVKGWLYWSRDGYMIKFTYNTDCITVSTIAHASVTEKNGWDDITARGQSTLGCHFKLLYHHAWLGEPRGLPCYLGVN